MVLLKIMKEQNSRVLEKFKKIQIAGFWKSFQISTEHNLKKYYLKKSNFLVNIWPRRHCMLHII